MHLTHWLISAQVPAISMAYEDAEADIMKRPPRNAATDHLSRASTRRLRLVEDAEVFHRADEDRENPTAPLEAEELAQITRAVIDQLPEKFRTILVLREFEGLSYTEIAAVLDCQLGTVESRLFRARKRFKDAMSQQHPELLPVAGAGRGGRR